MKSKLIYLQDKLDLIEKYKDKEIIVDTAPLILFLTGHYNYKSIGKTPLTHGYNEWDFKLLVYFLKRFKKIIVTPQILAETSNHLKNKSSKDDFENLFEKTLSLLLNTQEIYIEKNEILNKDELKKIGITDISIMQCCEQYNRLILTKDFNFTGICRSKGLPIIDFVEWEKAKKRF